MLKITYTEWLEMQLLQAEKKLQRNARSSHSDNEGELPDHVINLLPLPLRNIMRERNSKRISGTDDKSIPCKFKNNLNQSNSQNTNSSSCVYLLTVGTKGSCKLF